MNIAKKNSNYFKGDVLEISSNAQFLFDKELIEDTVNIKKRTVEPHRYIGNPIIKQEHAWERGMHLSTVLYDPIDKIYKMWYFTQHGNSSLCEQTMHYASSENGYTWEKPKLNKYFVKEFGDNNIVYVDLGGKVFYDKFDDVSRRYKLIHDTVDSGGLRIAYSADGIDWTMDERNPYKKFKYPAIFDMVHNDSNGKWQLFIRPILYSSGDYGSDRVQSIYQNSGNKRRRIAMCESDDLLNWTYPKIVCAPDESEDNEFDNFNVIQVNDLMIGFVGTFDEDDQDPDDEPIKRGQRFKANIKYSHLGQRWENAVLDPNTQYLKHGGEYDFDSQLVSLRGPIIDTGDGIQLLYYCGGHWTIPYSGYYQGGIGMLQILKDRFVESYAYGESGYILTKEFILNGDSLELNYQSQNKNGYIKVEIIEKQPLDDNEIIVHGGKLIKGYTLEECNPMRGGSIAETVCWNGNSDLSNLRGKAVSLRFFIKNAGVYTFRVFDDKK